jgi:hypothetical protein
MNRTAPHCIDDVDHRTPEQQRALQALHSDGGFSSWERTLAIAPPENRADVLRTAMIELSDLATKASVDHTEISDWGFRLGELHNIGGDADGLQAIIAEAIGITNSSPAQSVKPQQISDNWPEMDAAAYYGLAGEVVKTIDPHTEADPVAILLQLLAGFGNIIGSNPFYRIEGDQHHANLFWCLLAAQAKPARVHRPVGCARFRRMSMKRGPAEAVYRPVRA